MAPLRKGEVTAGPVVLANGKAVIASVMDVQPSHQATFEEAKTDVRNKASKEKLDKLLADKAKELVSKTQAMGGDLEKAAKSMGIEVKTSGDVDRAGRDRVGGYGFYDSGCIQQACRGSAGPGPGYRRQMVAKIISKTPANMAATACTDGQYSRRTEAAESSVTVRSFSRMGFEDRLTADGKLKIHQDVINRIVRTTARADECKYFLTS